MQIGISPDNWSTEFSDWFNKKNRIAEKKPIKQFHKYCLQDVELKV